MSIVGFDSVRPLLFRAIARLHRQGYVTTPSEASELLSDFRADAWPWLLERYEPNRGSFRTYVYGAFLHYARPLIAENMRWRRLTTELVQDIADREPARYTEGQLASLREALQTLSPRDQALLEARVSVGLSERDAARLFEGLTTHGFKRAFGEALARLALALGEVDMIDAADQPVARALWVEQRSVSDAAAALGLSTSQVQRARKRVIQTFRDSFLAGSLVGSVRGASHRLLVLAVPDCVAARPAGWIDLSSASLAKASCAGRRVSGAAIRVARPVARRYLTPGKRPLRSN